eukprot:3779313-Rhodomonas_salina.1
MSGYLAKDAEVTLEAASSARVCLSWDLFPGSVQTDLDCAGSMPHACDAKCHADVAFFSLGVRFVDDADRRLLLQQ